MLVSENRADDTSSNENNELGEPQKLTFQINVEDKLGVLTIWRREPP